MFKWIWNKELNCYTAKHNSTIRADKNGDVFGGGSTKIESPTPPAAPTATQSAADWAAALPSIYQTQIQYEPQLLQQQLAMQNAYAQPLLQQYLTGQQQYGTEMARQQWELQKEYAPQLAQQQYDITNQLYPQTAGLQEQLASQAQTGMAGGVPDWQRQQYLSDIRANLGTNIGSPIGAEYTSRGLLQQQQDWQRYYQNLGLSVTGRQPLTQPSTISQPQYNMPSYQGTNWTQGYTPQGVMNYNATNYGNYAGLYGNMYGANQRQNQYGSWWQSGLMNMAGQGVGGLATGIGYGMMSSIR